MIAIIVFAFLLGALLVLLLARFGTNPTVVAARQAERSRRHGPASPRVTRARLRALVVELLTAMGMRPEREPGDGDSGHLLAVRDDSFQPVRYLVFVEAEPPGDVVDAARVLELAETVKSERVALGILMTPYTIAADALPGLDVGLQLVDGARLRQLFAEHLPARLREVDGYRGFGVPGAIEPGRPVPPVETTPQPVA